MISRIADPGIQGIAEAVNGVTPGGVPVFLADDFFQILDVRFDRHPAHVANFFPVRGNPERAEKHERSFKDGMLFRKELDQAIFSVAGRGFCWKFERSHGKHQQHAIVYSFLSSNRRQANSFPQTHPPSNAITPSSRHTPKADQCPQITVSVRGMRGGR